MESNAIETALYLRVSELIQQPENQALDLLADLKAKKRILFKHKCKNTAKFEEQAARLLEPLKDKPEYAAKLAQVAKLREYLKMGIFIDFGHSGTKANRPELQEMLELAEQRQFQILETWSVDRFTREGLRKLFYYISLLDKNKVAFVSFKEPILDTTSPYRDLILALLGITAQLESKRQGERVKAGISRVIANGGEWGSKHEYSDEALQDMLALRKIGTGYLVISKIIEERHNVKVFPASIRFIVLKNEKTQGSIGKLQEIIEKAESKEA